MAPRPSLVQPRVDLTLTGHIALVITPGTPKFPNAPVKEQSRVLNVVLGACRQITGKMELFPPPGKKKPLIH